MAEHNEVTFTTEESGANSPAPIQEQDYSNDPDRPEWLPQQFRTVQDFVGSYNETKSTLTRTQQELANRGLDEEAPPQQEQQTPQQAQDDNLDEAVENISDKAGFDLTPYQAEFFEQQDVSEQSRNEIADGLKDVLGDNARSIVDQFVETRKVTQANDMRLYMDAGGGEAQYTEMVSWASQNQDPTFIEQFNRQVNSGDRSTVLFAIESLRTRYEQTNGRSPQMLGGRNPANSGSRPFRSTAEMVQAMKDPKYKTDEAYRNDVAARMAVSQFGESP